MATTRRWLLGSTLASSLALTLMGGAQAALTVLPFKGTDAANGYSDIEFVYDSVLNVTWFRDASLGGSRFWSDANSWANNLSVTVTGPGGSSTYSNWALPSMVEITPGEFNYAYDGTADAGHNITRSSSQLSHLYYVSLGNTSFYNAAGVGNQPGFGLTKPGPFLFQNLPNNVSFWYGTESSFFASLALNPVHSNAHAAWFFGVGNGAQDVTNTNRNQAYAWAVHPGQLMAPVPEPHEWAMMLAGLGVVGGMARLRRRLGASAL